MSIMTCGFLRSECCHVAQENEEKTPSLEITVVQPLSRRNMKTGVQIPILLLTGSPGQATSLAWTQCAYL